MNLFLDRRQRRGCFAVFCACMTFLATGNTAIAQTATSSQTFDDQASSYRLFMLGRHFEGEGELESAIAAFRDAAQLDREAAEPVSGIVRAIRTCRTSR